VAQCPAGMLPVIVLGTGPPDLPPSYTQHPILSVGSELWQVVLLKNLNVEGGLVNGSRGIVVGFVEPGDEDVEQYSDGPSRDQARTQPHVGGESSPAVVRCGKGVLLVPVVRFPSTRMLGDVAIRPAVFDVEMGGKPVASRFQIPLRLAWALSIHKSQARKNRPVFLIAVCPSLHCCAS